VTAKFALEGFSEALALEVAQFGVKVTVVEPGAMATTLASSMSLPEPAPYVEVMAPMLKRYGDPQARLGVSPQRAAEVLLGLLDLPELGDERKIAELDRWEDLSRSSDA
jgi:NAD(P)-dependent dehydrogenase (short-subunit alcohol dehydrogenase family)